MSLIASLICPLLRPLYVLSCSARSSSWTPAGCCACSKNIMCGWSYLSTPFLQHPFPLLHPTRVALLHPTRAVWRERTAGFRHIHVLHVLCPHRFLHSPAGYIYLYLCVCVCVCMYIDMFIYVYIHTHTHTHTHVYIYIYVCVYIYTCPLSTHVYTHICMYMHKYRH